jgi:NDP-sugar pyrophosphorylase family protein
VHVISAEIFDLITEHGKFSILDPYLRLAGAGHPILPFDVTGALWLEVGTPERLEEARRRLGV